LNIVSLKWRNHATMKTAVDKICETCRYWSELAIRSAGLKHSLEALCLNREGPFYSRFCGGAERCPSWASGHLGAIDDPDLPEGAYANQGVAEPHNDADAAFGRRGGVNPATSEAEPFRTLIRRGAAGDGCGDLSDGSTVSIRRGKSRREAAQVFGLSRDTIAKMFRYTAPPGYVRSKAPERPKLGRLVPVIDAGRRVPELGGQLKTTNKRLDPRNDR
jgi:hypothetical protein